MSAWMLTEFPPKPNSTPAETRGKYRRQGMGGVSMRYPEDTSRWEDWELEYRYGGFYIFPPTGIIEVVDELRRKHDPRSYRACQAHVTLTEPLPRPLTDEDLPELSAVLSRIPPFVLSYGDVHATVPYPGVVYGIEPVDRFMSLREAIHGTSLFEDSPLSRKDVPPHMTIAEFISLEDSIALEATLSGQLDEGEWLCAEIEYAVPDEDLRFHRVLTFPLGIRR